MRKTVALPFIGIALASVIAAGCSGTGAYNPNANSTPTPLPSPTIACTTSMFPAGEQVQMVFPQNGGTAVANLQGVVFAVAPNPLPTNWFVYATFGTQSTEFTNSIAFLAVPTPSASATPTPLPTPSDMPSPSLGPNPIYETASIGTFANSTGGASKFTIFLATASCSPGIAYSTFTTSVNDQPSPSPSPTST
jgi:hypothetical protein